MKLSIATLADGRGIRPEDQTFDYAVLGRLGSDDDAITETSEALREGRIVRDEIPYILSRIIEATLGKQTQAEKMRYYGLYTGLLEALVALGISAEELGDSRRLGQVVAKMNEVEDSHLLSAQRYEDLFWLAVVSPGAGSGMDKMTKGKAISTGAVLARAKEGGETLDGMFQELAGRCLRNALENGGVWTRFHSSEALEIYFGMDTSEAAKGCLREIIAGGDAKETAFAAITLEKRHGVEARELVSDRIWQGEGDGRKDAIEAYLRAYRDDKVALHSLAVMAESNRMIRHEVALMAKHADERELAGIAGEAMRMIRNRDELDSAVEDRKFLCEDILQDTTTPQRAYVECVFEAVEKVLGSGSHATRTVEYQIALKQLASFGADPGAMKEMLDSHTLKVIRRNVENALVHAMTASEHKDLAASGLEKIASDRVEDVLEKIVAREGEASPSGKAASDTLERIRGKKVEESMVFITQAKPPKPPALAQRQRLLQ